MEAVAAAVPWEAVAQQQLVARLPVCLATLAAHLLVAALALAVRGRHGRRVQRLQRDRLKLHLCIACRRRRVVLAAAAAATLLFG